MKNIDISRSVLFEFPNEQLMKAFMTWFSDGGGEAGAYESCKIHAEVHLGFDYQQCFSAWGYKGGLRKIVAKIVEEEGII